MIRLGPCPKFGGKCTEAMFIAPSSTFTIDYFRAKRDQHLSTDLELSGRHLALANNDEGAKVDAVCSRRTERQLFLATPVKFGTTCWWETKNIKQLPQTRTCWPTWSSTCGSQSPTDGLHLTLVKEGIRFPANVDEGAKVHAACYRRSEREGRELVTMENTDARGKQREPFNTCRWNTFKEYWIYMPKRSLSCAKVKG